MKTALESGLQGMLKMLGPPEVLTVAGNDLDQWRDAFRVLQSREVWAAHREWVMREKPAFGPGVRERFSAAAQLTTQEIESAESVRENVRIKMNSILGAGTILLLPTAPGIAPLLNTTGPELEEFRKRALGLLCIAGHAGLPQISLPLGHLDGCPVGLSLIGPRYSDETLMDLAKQLALCSKGKI